MNFLPGPRASIATGDRDSDNREAPSDSQTGLRTADADLFNAILFHSTVPRLFERIAGAASWLALGKVVLIAGAVLSSARLASASAPLNPLVYALTFVTFGTVGAWLVVGGQWDRGARFLGGFFLVVALAGARGASRALGARLAGGAGAAVLTHLDPLLPFLLWVFAREFPSRLADGPELRLLRAMLTVCLVSAAVLLTVNFAAETGSHMPATLLVGSSDGYWGITFGLTVLAFPYLLSRCVRTSGADGLRASWMVLGLVVGLGPLLLEVVAEATIPRFGTWATTTNVRAMLGTVLFAFVLTLPFSTAYAVIARQTLDVRVVLRRALQCSLLKYACAVTCVIPLVYLSWLAYDHRDMPIAEVAAMMSTRAALVAVLLGVVGLFLYPRLLHGLDRLFFGPKYDARAVSGEFRGAIWRSANEHASAALLARTAKATLSCTTASVLLRDGTDGHYEDGDFPARLPCDSMLIDVLARDSRSVIPVTDRLVASVGTVDARWLTQSAAVLLVPLRSVANDILGILGVGIRSDERPYYVEDRDLLTDLAMCASPILERQLAQSARHTQRAFTADIAAAECPTCGLVVASDEASECQQCAKPLERCTLPLVVNGKYRIRARAGRGGMSVVYRAEDQILQRTVALKALPYSSRVGEVRTAGEGRVMAGLVHLNLATVFGCEVSGGRPVLVLEYLDGGTLKDRLRQKPLAISETFEIGMSVCDALSWLHRHRVSHGDIKPSNIGFSATGVAKLLDFGLAETGVGDPARVQSQGMRGTLQYRCPYQSTVSSAANDLWALSAVLFECLAGRRLFDVVASLPPHSKGPDVRQFRPEVSPELAAFLSAALSPNPVIRPRAADEFRLWLERATPI